MIRHKWKRGLCALAIVFALLGLEVPLMRGQEIKNRIEIVVIGTVATHSTGA